MRRKTRPVDTAKTHRLPRRRRDNSVPAVPTVRPDAKTEAAKPSSPEDDPANEAVRRIVEAAYT